MILNRKDIFMTGFKSKLGFAFTRKDMEEFETIIDFYEKENARLKDKFKDLEEWLESMVSMYENEYKDVNASEHYKCMLHKLKET